MKIAVIGAGGVGGCLARTGADVTFVARGAHLAAMREKGASGRGRPRRNRNPFSQATDGVASIGPVDIVLFCVKLWDVEAAGGQMLAGDSLGEGPVSGRPSMPWFTISAPAMLRSALG